MKLNFTAGKNKRLVIDFDTKTFCTNYSWLGGHRSYIKVSAADYKSLIEELLYNGFSEVLKW